MLPFAALLPVAAFLSFVVLPMVYGYLADNGYLYERKEYDVKLTCRTLKNKVENTNQCKNRFAREMDQLALYITDVIDFAVCKYVTPGALPVLVEQEHNHARMHAVNKTRNVKRFEVVRKVFYFLLMGCGRTIGLGLTCALEIANSTFSQSVYGQKLIPNMCSNAMVFHLLEEMEHACVTVSHLRPQVPWYARLALSPVVMGSGFVYAFAPVLTHLLVNPGDVFDLSMYKELGLYVLVMTKLFAVFSLEIIMHFAPPGPHQGETPAKRNARVDLMDRVARDAGIEFVIGEEASYKVVM